MAWMKIPYSYKGTIEKYEFTPEDVRKEEEKKEETEKRQMDLSIEWIDVVEVPIALKLFFHPKDIERIVEQKKSNGKPLGVEVVTLMGMKINCQIDEKEAEYSGQIIPVLVGATLPTPGKEDFGYGGSFNDEGLVVASACPPAVIPKSVPSFFDIFDGEIKKIT